MPKVSIIMVSKNGSHLIGHAMESVFRQAFRDFEFIIIDDGSTDGTESVVKSFRDPRVVFVKNELSRGLTKCLNQGLALAKGEYVARIDDDDAWVSVEKLGKQVAYLDGHRGCVLVGTWTIVIAPDGAELYRVMHPESDGAIRGQMLFSNPFTHSSVLFCKDAAVRIGGYDEKYLYVQDHDMWMRLGAIGTLANLARFDVTWRTPDRAKKQNRAKKQAVILDIIWRNRFAYPHFGHAYSKAFLKWLVFLVFPKPNAAERWIGQLRRRILPGF